ncbi:unnamed protein product [Blepharisma stoltei]|uniref:Uncharacterized protein n=1 Tax=Blepharisma stoltei TaxID=1481888 RepID=A0AAU9JMJ7_9CILI|nr:unnamed protein product [Blepharisma stoltei]
MSLIKLAFDLFKYWIFFVARTLNPKKGVFNVFSSKHSQKYLYRRSMTKFKERKTSRQCNIIYKPIKLGLKVFLQLGACDFSSQ